MSAVADPPISDKIYNRTMNKIQSKIYLTEAEQNMNQHSVFILLI
jgi:ribosomal protein L31E